MKKEDIDWRKLFLRFMEMYGEQQNEWYPEYWEAYGITDDEARAILNEYEKEYPEDMDDDGPNIKEFRT